jgi:hypothetical protein
VNFSSGKVGFVRKVLKAGILQNSIIRADLEEILSFPNSKVEWNGRQRGTLGKNSKENRWIS